MNTCYKCDLCITRNNIVYGNGNIKSKIMIIGEAPGYHEDKKGIPFIGLSGSYLRKVLLDLGYTDEVLYITNIIKCRPPENRTPSTEEINRCTKYFLAKEITNINPKVIITVGKISSCFFTGDSPLANSINTIYNINNVFIIPVYHPSYILRTNNQEYYENRFKDIHRFITNNL